MSELDEPPCPPCCGGCDAPSSAGFPAVSGTDTCHELIEALFHKFQMQQLEQQHWIQSTLASTLKDITEMVQLTSLGTSQALSPTNLKSQVSNVSQSAQSEVNRKSQGSTSKHSDSDASDVPCPNPRHEKRIPTKTSDALHSDSSDAACLKPRKEKRIPTDTSDALWPSNGSEYSDTIPKRRRSKGTTTFDAMALNPVKEGCEVLTEKNHSVIDMIDDLEASKRRSSFRDQKALSAEIIAIVERDERLAKLKVGRNMCLNATWHFLTDPDSSWAAKVYKEAMNPMIVVSALLSLAQGIDPIFINDGTFVVDMAFDVMFLLDILLQFFCSPNRLIFITSMINVIDFVSSFSPLVLRCYTGFTVPDGDSGVDLYIKTLLLCVLPVGRLLKLLRRFEKFHLVFRAFADSFEALPALLYTLSIMALSFTAVIYLVEDRENIETLPEALWFVIVTMMTVGYGDITPQSTMGYVIVSILIICSVLYMSIPIGIVGNAFNRVWRDRKNLLLIKKTRDRLLQWGVRPRDLFVLFNLFDRNQSGELTFRDFSKMMTLINVGLCNERVEELFRAFDTAGTETVDAREFIRGIFPNSYYALYGEAVGGERVSVGRPSVSVEDVKKLTGSFVSEGSFS